MHTTVPALSGEDLYLEIDDLLVHVWASGDPDRPPVVVLHGIMGHAREWDVLSGALADHYRVYSVDQRGHGLSAWALDYSVASLASDLIGVVESLELRKPHVVAHSMGGMAALTAAWRHPVLFGRLVIVDIGPQSVTGPIASALSAWIELLGKCRYGNVEEAVDQWMGDPLARPDLMRHYVVHNLVAEGPGSLRWRFDAGGLRHFLRDGVTAEDLWRAVEGVRSPTLLLRGEHSAVLGHDDARLMVERLHAGEFEEVAGGGHDLGVQQPEVVAQATLAFLAPEHI